MSIRCRGRRGRLAQDGDRRAHRGRRDQGAPDRAHDLRTGQAVRPQDHADRAGAAEHLHQLGRQYRARRNHPGAARISGTGEAIRRHVLAADPAGRRAALQSGSRSCRMSICGPTATDGARPPIRCRIAPASSRPYSIRATIRRSIRCRSRYACRPAFRSARVKSHHHAVKVETDADTQVIRLRRQGAGRPRFRADLEVCGAGRAFGRAVPRARRQRRLPARLRHAALARTGAGAACRARRSS